MAATTARKVVVQYPRRTMEDEDGCDMCRWKGRTWLLKQKKNLVQMLRDEHNVDTAKAKLSDDDECVDEFASVFAHCQVPLFSSQNGQRQQIIAIQCLQI